MKAVTIEQKDVRGADVLRMIDNCLVVCVVYALQRMACALGMMQRWLLKACAWLNSRHNFGDEDGAVIMTGWQYLGFGTVVMVVSMILSIKW